MTALRSNAYGITARTARPVVVWNTIAVFVNLLTVAHIFDRPPGKGPCRGTRLSACIHVSAHPAPLHRTKVPLPCRALSVA